MSNSEYMKERYQFLKDHGICVRCGKEKAERNRVTCYWCSCYCAERQEEKRNNLTKEEKHQIYKNANEYHKKLYYERKLKGLCTRCGSKNNNGKTMCNVCLRKKSDAAKNKRLKDGKISAEMRGNGIYCEKCCNIVETKGKKLCDSCHKKACASLAKARQSASENNYFRKSINAFWVGRKEKGNK